MAGNAALHIGGTASIDAAVLDGGGPRVVAPAFATAHRHDTCLPVPDVCTPPARALQRCNDVRASFIASVHGYIGRMLLQGFPIRFPHVDIETDLSHVVGEKLLDLRFIPGDAGDGDHLLQKSDRLFTAVVDLLHKCLVETRTHLRTPKNPVAGASLSLKRRFHLSQSASIDVAALDLQAAGDEFYARVAALRRRNRGINLHDRPRSAMALMMRCGVIGDINNSAPSGRSASFTALAMAAGGAIAPPSPMPLTPNSV